MSLDDLLRKHVLEPTPEEREKGISEVVGITYKSVCVVILESPKYYTIGHCLTSPTSPWFKPERAINKARAKALERFKLRGREPTHGT